MVLKSIHLGESRVAWNSNGCIYKGSGWPTALQHSSRRMCAGGGTRGIIGPFTSRLPPSLNLRGREGGGGGGGSCIKMTNNGRNMAEIWQDPGRITTSIRYHFANLRVIRNANVNGPSQTQRRPARSTGIYWSSVIDTTGNRLILYGQGNL